MTKSIGLLISVSAGYLAAMALGVISFADMQHIKNSDLVALPKLDHYGWSFDVQMLPAFLVAGLAASLKALGLVVTSQKSMTQIGVIPIWKMWGKAFSRMRPGRFRPGFWGPSEPISPPPVWGSP